MLSEKQLNDLLAIFLKRTQSVVEEYLIRMGEQIQDIGKLIPSSINRLVQLKRMNANLDAIKREIARLAEISMEDLEKIFAAAAESDARFVAEKFGNEYKTPILENYALQQILKAQLRVTLNEMANISRTRISSIAYQNAVDKAIQAAQMGVEDYNKAVRRALSEAAEAGIRMEIGHTGAYEKRIGYGGRYTRRLDSAVRQNVLDGIRSLNNEVLAQAGEEFGADGVEISAHMLCAEDHLPYQGRQFSNARFLEIQEEELDRPFGMWNCRHSIYPIILGVSRPTYTEEELAAFERNSKERIEIDGITKTRYQWTQEQRRIETAVRRQKDVAVAFKASGDMQGRREVQANINVLMEKYKGISEKINVKQQYDRMRVDGFSAVKAADGLKTHSKRGKINTKIGADGEVLNPMDASRYRRIKDGLSKNGITVMEARGDDLRYLKYGISAEATYSNGYIMHIGSIPSASAMFEEIIHSTQAKKYGELMSNDMTELSAREVAANRMLLEHGAAYGFNEIDFEDIKNNLSYWERRYRKETGYNYDDGKHNRQI